MFAGTSSGAIRAIKFPLGETGEWQEYQAHCGPITRVRTMFNYAVLSVPHNVCICGSIIVLFV